MKMNKCYLCNDVKHKVLYTRNKFTIAQCDSCGFVYVVEKVGKNKLMKYYNNFDYKSIFSAEQIIRRDAKRSCSIIKEVVDKLVFLFDVGCGRGFFLDEARRFGWQVSGIDTSKTMVLYAQNNLKLEVEHADINNFQSTEKYSVVTLNQVIEHFSNPLRVLRICNGLLQNGGYIYIATPNINSVPSKIHKENFDHLIPPEHLSYFSEHTLKSALAKCGFKVVYSGSWSYPADLGGVIKKLVSKWQRNDLIKTTLSPKDYFPSREDNVKKLKSFLFDRIFCSLFYPVLNFDSWGTNLEMIAKKT